ncbi:hypothetical protein [Chromobacterium violaceum]|uniref:hypothetical protein n=1 Tax=Chromobacterium violaceum TaxID=536 RepID=UPI001124F08F|nr:hypothetical protein [Chromobacterium violaceum]
MDERQPFRDLLKKQGPEGLRDWITRNRNYERIDYAQEVLWEFQCAEENERKRETAKAIASAKESAQHARSSARWTMIAALVSAGAALLNFADNHHWLG